MIIELLGVRGSLPTPLGQTEYREKIKSLLKDAIDKRVSAENIDSFLENEEPHLSGIYGGNTTCVSVTSKSGKLYILDCGTGIRPLGDRLIKGEAAQGKAEFHIFITHTHWDHINSIPFFKPIYVPGNRFNFYSPLHDLHERLSYQQTFKFFPKEFDMMESTKEFHVLKRGEKLQLEENLYVEFFPLKHPGGSFAYKFTEDDKVFIFATDAEFSGAEMERVDEVRDSFFRNADMLILDAQYTLDEAFSKFDWGHTSFTMAVNCGIHWNVKKLVLTHHEPSYSDAKLTSMFIEAVEHRDAVNLSTPEIIMAQEGLKFSI